MDGLDGARNVQCLFLLFVRFDKHRPQPQTRRVGLAKSSEALVYVCVCTTVPTNSPIMFYTCIISKIHSLFSLIHMKCEAQGMSISMFRPSFSKVKLCMRGRIHGGSLPLVPRHSYWKSRSRLIIYERVTLGRKYLIYLPKSIR